MKISDFSEIIIDGKKYRMVPDESLEDLLEGNNLSLGLLKPPGGLTLGYVIRLFRAREHLSQAELARVAGVSRGCLIQLEDNKNPTTYAKSMNKLAEFFGPEFLAIVERILKQGKNNFEDAS